MITPIWRVVKDWSYRRGMSRRSISHISPVPRPDDLDQFAGLWVAIKDGTVIATAHNSRDLVPIVRKMGAKGDGAVARFVPHRSEEIVIGVG